MKKTIVVSKEFERLRSDIEHFLSVINPESADQSGKELCVERVSIGGMAVDAIWCQCPPFYQKFTMKEALGSQAKRMFQEALWMAEKGIRTAVPIACIDFVAGGTVRKSLFLCVGENVEPVLPKLGLSLPESREMIGAYAKFLHRLHLLGVFVSGNNPNNLRALTSSSELCWAVDGNLTLQHQTIRSRRVIKDLEAIDLPFDNYRYLVHRYVAVAQHSAFNSFEHWVFYQDMLKWSRKMNVEVASKVEMEMSA